MIRLNTSKFGNWPKGPASRLAKPSFFMPGLMGGGGGGTQYSIANSLRFRSSNSAMMSQTFAGAPTSTRLITFSWWEKNSVSTTNKYFYTCGTSAGVTNYPECGILSGGSGGSFEVYSYNGAYQFQVQAATSMRFRDPLGHLHKVVQIDTTQAVASDRVKMYVNNVQVTSFGVANYPALNFDFRFGTSGVAHYINTLLNSGQYGDVIVSDFYVIDGQALTPSSFGRTNPRTGQWSPKAYTGTFGTNGFYLKFADNSAATAAAIGKDSSPNARNWTPSGISISAGTSNDSLSDTPTNNFATANPLFRHPAGSYVPTFSDANLATTHSGAGVSGTVLTMPVTTGKWWFKLTPTNTNAVSHRFGIVASNTPEAANIAGEFDPGQTSYGVSYHSDGTRVFNSVNTGSWGATYTNGDEVTVAFDADTGKVWFQKGATWQGSGDPVAGTNPAATLPTGVPFHVWWAGANGTTYSVNPGSRSYTNAPPTGFNALCTANLPTPAFPNAADAYLETTYTGNGSTQAIPIRFQTDLIKQKSRSVSRPFRVLDSARGFNNVLTLEPAGAAQYAGSSVASVTASAINLQNADNYNVLSETYVMQAWRVGPQYGCVIVTYTGNGGTQAIAHSLGVKPDYMEVRAYQQAYRWTLYHRGVGAAQYGYLNDALAFTTANANLRWGNNSTTVEPTSTNFTVGNSNDVNQNGVLYVAYLYVAVPGLSSFASYTGNSSASHGPFVNLGFKPRTLTIYEANLATDHQQYSLARQPQNGSRQVVWTSLSSPETSNNNIDIHASGFRPIVGAGAAVNDSGNTYLVMAWAEAPFKYATAV